MLNIGGLKDGIVLDHIQAGKSMDIYKYLKLDKLDCQVIWMCWDILTATSPSISSKTKKS